MILDEPSDLAHIRTMALNALGLTESMRTTVLLVEELAGLRTSDATRVRAVEDAPSVAGVLRSGDARPPVLHAMALRWFNASCVRAALGHGPDVVETLAGVLHEAFNMGVAERRSEADPTETRLLDAYDRGFSAGRYVEGYERDNAKRATATSEAAQPDPYPGRVPGPDLCQHRISPGNWCSQCFPMPRSADDQAFASAVEQLNETTDDYNELHEAAERARDILGAVLGRERDQPKTLGTVEEQQACERVSSSARKSETPAPRIRSNSTPAGGPEEAGNAAPPVAGASPAGTFGSRERGESSGAPAPNACKACGKPSTWSVNTNCGLNSVLNLVPCCANSVCEAKLAPGLAALATPTPSKTPLDIVLLAQEWVNDHRQCDSYRREREDLEALLMRVRDEGFDNGQAADRAGLSSSATCLHSFEREPCKNCGIRGMHFRETCQELKALRVLAVAAEAHRRYDQPSSGAALDHAIAAWRAVPFTRPERP